MTPNRFLRLMSTTARNIMKAYAMKHQGMRTLKQSALRYLGMGITTVEEVMKVAYYEE